MSRRSQALFGRPAVSRAGAASKTASRGALVAILVSIPFALADAAVSTTDSTQPSPGKLTIETAKPLPVPPPPNLGRQPQVKAPPRFVTPQVMDAPPVPELTVGPQPQQRPAKQTVGKPPSPPAAAAADTAPPPAATTPVTKAPAPPLAPPAAVATAPAAPPAPPPVGVAPTPAPVAPMAVPQPPRSETAALPPPAAPARPAPAPGTLSLVFEGGETGLPEADEAKIRRIADRMQASPNARLQLRSYAGGTPETAREARQLSLSRALLVRERLAAYGVRSTRVDVRPLGIDPEAGPPDRIDVEFQNE